MQNESAIDPGIDMATLLAGAAQAAENAYAPYSGFRVGAALLLQNGAMVTGANVESVSYGLTICAERAALVRAVAEFGPRIRVQALAVTNLNQASSPPCGACRQMLAEFVDADAPLAFAYGGAIRTVSFGEILPMAFEMNSSRGV